ncbi:hypothetical protein KDW_48480 [Dictyobacter vulcani]|uniref:Pyridoxamine 5'-phosphate oxidase n=1 Tax=Dictyobacter vulcani TaxID=2607529 RepID=A0A5J4KZN6_9CHLR|nr:pyridoxamine 5'-phosphate oxidase family protein [Dictyobacter vulcani]GER90686.1 hypothetical protein KDW_48480 [Dictyobacter vulcani]
MYGELTRDQIDEVLEEGSIGRIGCQMQGKIHIVPINYVYDGTDIYANTLDGAKLRMMRSHPEVCFQVDQIENHANWRSVLVWGRFQELTGDEASRAVDLLTHKHIVMIASGQSLHAMWEEDSVELPPDIIVYRLHLTEKTGRFERSDL